MTHTTIATLYDHPPPAGLLEKGQDPELCVRCVVLLLRIHQKPLVANRSMQDQIRKASQRLAMFSSGQDRRTDERTDRRADG